MSKTGLNEIREEYLKFFESKGHLRLPSASLVPENDPTLLLINAGMAPFKTYFTGAEEPPSKRITTCQKCIRTIDIDIVGQTSRHGTFFEMLGNFSFGDYFKEEIIPWAWEFLTKVMELPEDKLWPSVYLEDDEAEKIWIKTGVPKERIVRLGKADNFWELETGPCGPCSEIYYDRGIENGCDDPDCKPGCDCDRYIEIWNLVFTQFNRETDGSYTKLDNPNIDTGMGLERIASVKQGVDNLFEVDTIRNILNKVCEISGVEYKKDKNKDISIRIVTDHIRSASMIISDGVLPSNEGRGYVLRRILRRAARHGKLLGIKNLFLTDLVDTVIQESGNAYPNLIEKREYIKKIVSVEEEKFNDTIDQGLKILSAYIDETVKSGSKILEGEKVFKLHDTYGFPIDLTREIAGESGIETDETGFKEEMSKQKQRAREAVKTGNDSWSGDNTIEGMEKTSSTVFTGYDEIITDTVIKYIIKDSKTVGEAGEGEFVSFVLDRTPFYAQMGGQSSDHGIITSMDKSSVARVTDCRKTPEGKFIHSAEIEMGNFAKNQEVTAIIDNNKRMNIKRNHTATHLLQRALKNVLGSHVQQAGSSVDEDRLRFDFSHFQAMTKEEIQQAENEVNEKIFEDIAVECRSMPIEEAKKIGATALFGEKYGDTVRVVSAGDYSIEFCGGTHVSSTGQISMVKIISEGGIAAGVRRIEALTGRGALEYFKNKDMQVEMIADTLKVNKTDIVKRIDQVTGELKEISKENSELKNKIMRSSLDDLLKDVKEIDGIKVLSTLINDQDGNSLREMGDMLKDKMGKNAAVILISPCDEKVNITVTVSKEAVSKGIHAGNTAKQIAAFLGGGGGGRPDIAQAGGKDVSKAKEAVEKAFDIVKNSIGK